MANYSELISGVRAVFRTGRTKTYEWRKQQLTGLVKLIDENKDRISDALYKDLHKPLTESVVFEVEYCKNDAVDTINNLQEWMKPEKVKKGLLYMMDNCYIHKEPFGVALIIGAWNYPFQLTILPMIGALAAGNCVILKPSEVAMATAQLLEEILPKYVDSDCIKVVNGGIPETQALLQERFDHIFYTGNSAVGKIILQAAAKYLTPVTLELGGKSPVYVDKTCDLGVVANRLLWGKCTNAGQTCVAPDYVMCTEDIQADLLAKLKMTLDDFYPNKSCTSSNDYGRIINDRHFQRVKSLVSGGGTLAIGGELNESEKYISPTVLSDVKLTDRIMQEEVFGPVLPVVTVRDENEAIDYINSKEKPLAMYIFTNDKKVSKKFLDSTSSGAFVVNDTMMHGGVMTLPFGGVGNSGHGNYHGKFTFDTFSHRRACLVKDQRLESVNFIRYPPYSERKMSIINWLLQKKMKRSSLYTIMPFFVLGTLFAVMFKVFGLQDWVFRS